MHIFEGIGRIGAYTQMKMAQYEAKYRIRTGQSLRQAMGGTLPSGQTKTNELQKTAGTRDESRMASIRQKLRQGRKLSAIELKYLKENDEDLYEKACRVQDRREALARALKNAKTKQEALRAVAQANIAVLAEWKATGGAQLNLHEGGGGSSEGVDSSAAGEGVMAEDGALDAGTEEAAASTGQAQGVLGREALAAQGVGTDAAAAAAVQTDTAKEQHDAGRESRFQEGPSTRDSYGNRRVLSREEVADMIRTAKEQSKITPFDHELVYALRALQREWMEYSNTDEYKELPNTELDATAEEQRGGQTKRRTVETAPAASAQQGLADILAAAQRYYIAAQQHDHFIAKG